MNKAQWMAAVMRAAGEMPKYERELCQLDTLVGDGDHGVTVSRGFRSVVQRILVEETTELSDFCSRVGEVLAESMGGAIGPVYGLFWKEMAKAMQGGGDVTSQMMSRGMNGAVARIMRVCRVQPGEKTVLDAMLPCAQAMEVGAQLPLEEMMALAADAARAGRDATRDMVAKKGRARFLAEKSLGHVDAGASSFALFMQQWQSALGAKG